MNNNLTRLAKRREHLVAQAQAQRLALADAIEGLRKPLDMTDKGLAVLRYVRSHPISIKFYINPQMKPISKLRGVGIIFIVQLMRTA